MSASSVSLKAKRICLFLFPSSPSPDSSLVTRLILCFHRFFLCCRGRPLVQRCFRSTSVPALSSSSLFSPLYNTVVSVESSCPKCVVCRLFVATYQSGLRRGTIRWRHFPNARHCQLSLRMFDLYLFLPRSFLFSVEIVAAFETRFIGVIT